MTVFTSGVNSLTATNLDRNVQLYVLQSGRAHKTTSTVLKTKIRSHIELNILFSRKSVPKPRGSEFPLWYLKSGSLSVPQLLQEIFR